MVLAPQDPVPDMPGAYEQDSIRQMLDNLNEYEELFLVELMLLQSLERVEVFLMFGKIAINNVKLLRINPGCIHRPMNLDSSHYGIFEE